MFSHGMPDLEHAWSLDGRPKKKGKALVRRCPECGALIPIAVARMPGMRRRPAAEPVAAERPVPEPLIELDPATAHERWFAHGSVQGRDANGPATTKRACARSPRARGYKPGWVYFRLKAERDAAEDALLRAPMAFQANSLKEPDNRGGQNRGDISGE